MSIVSNLAGNPSQHFGYSRDCLRCHGNWSQHTLRDCPTSSWGPLLQLHDVHPRLCRCSAPKSEAASCDKLWSCYVQIDEAVTQIFAHEIPTASPPWITLLLHASPNNKLALPQSNSLNLTHVHFQIGQSKVNGSPKQQEKIGSRLPLLSRHPQRRRIHAVLPSARHDLIQSRALTLCKTTTSVISEQATISSAHLHCTTATSNLLYLQLKILATSTFTQTSIREQWPLQTPQDKPDPGCRSCRGTHSPGCSLPFLRHATLHVKYQNEKAPWGQAAHTSHLAQDQPPTSRATIFDTYPVPHKHIKSPVCKIYGSKAQRAHNHAMSCQAKLRHPFTSPYGDRFGHSALMDGIIESQNIPRVEEP